MVTSYEPRRAYGRAEFISSWCLESGRGAAATRLEHRNSIERADVLFEPQYPDRHNVAACEPCRAYGRAEFISSWCLESGRGAAATRLEHWNSIERANVLRGPQYPDHHMVTAYDPRRAYCRAEFISS
eukprot:g5642.t1